MQRLARFLAASCLLLAGAAPRPAAAAGPSAPSPAGHTGTGPQSRSEEQAAASKHTPTLPSFLQTYCLECHGAEKQKGDRRFDQLALPAENADSLLGLQEIVDELNLGEMPPRKARQPSPEETSHIIAALTGLVSEGSAKLATAGGHTGLRRLNRREYVNTVGDLCGLNMLMFDPTTKFPRDETVQHMDNVGDALKTSSYLLRQYLEAADQVIEKAFATQERPQEQTWTFNSGFLQQQELRTAHDSAFNHRYLCLYDNPDAEDPEGAYGPLIAFSQGVPVDGWYEVKVKAEAKNRHTPYDREYFGRDPEEPFRLGIVPGDRRIGELHLAQPIQPALGEVTLKDDQPEWYTFRVWLDAGYSPRFTFPNGQSGVRKTWVRIFKQYHNDFPEEVRSTSGIVAARVAVVAYGFTPHIRIHEVQVRGPLVAQWPPAPQAALFGGAPFAPERTRSLLEQFANRAYRRPARPEEIDRLMNVVQQSTKQGHPPFEAFKDGLKTALCSPAFLYLADPPETPKAAHGLSAHALATRLSYFLWSTMPDDELRHSANDGTLLQPAVLSAQTRRLLASPRSDAFVTGLLASWLNLRSLGDMAPDRGEFSSYYTERLQLAMKRETELFTRDLITRNESILRFLDADYTFANRALARLYGQAEAVPPATAGEFQKIKLASPLRGGLLGQGSVLTVSANGVETSPVTRGVWLLENILGTPPSPPPDNVPAIDPDVRGASSMRELLTKHRSNPACYECHRKIDPLGFALECFDPIGAERATYGKGGPIDTSGELPSGQKFKDAAELKKILLERKTSFARMLTERLLGYACGRQVEPLDRLEVNRIVQKTADQEYPFRDLIEEVILSQAFRSP